MKHHSIPRSARAFLVAGLMITSLTPILCRHFALPDFFYGFSTGLGLALEVIAIVKIQRSRKCRNAG